MNLTSAVLLSTALAGLALWKKALTYCGTFLAWAMATVICIFGGIPAFLILALTFFGTVVADKAAGKRADPHGLRRKSGRRDAVRVLCNVGIGTGMILLYTLTGTRGFLLAYAAVMAESLADSLASKLGPLGKGPTVDLCGFHQVDVGLSGGVSLAGTAASAFGASLIAVPAGLFPGTGAKKAALVAVIGFAGCLFDSLLGSRAQVKYKCSACGCVTEREQHCGASCSVYRGFRRINNDLVNFLSNCFAAAIAMIIF